MEQENDWDVIGDYRVPYDFGYTTNLKLTNEVVEGFIVGNGFLPAEYNTYKYDYDTFKNSWNTNMNCSGVLSIDDFSKKESFWYTNPVQNTLKISTNLSTSFVITIYNLNGNKIASFSSSKKDILLDLSKYATGIYLLRLASENKFFKTFKIVKTNSVF